MHKKLYNIGRALLFIGLLLIFFGFLFSERFFLFDYNILWEKSKLTMIFGLSLFILGAVFTMIGTLLKEKLQPKVIQKDEGEVCSGICPVCHQEFKTTAESIGGYYVFNCNNCHAKLRLKKSTYYPTG